MVAAFVGAIMMARVCVQAGVVGVDRSAELAVGSWLREHGEDAVLLAPQDYGYFAILAAMRSKDRVTLASSVDPRERGVRNGMGCPFEREDMLRERVGNTSIRWLVAHGEKGEVSRRFGDVRYAGGQWVVVEREVTAERF